MSDLNNLNNQSPNNPEKRKRSQEQVGTTTSEVSRVLRSGPQPTPSKALSPLPIRVTRLINSTNVRCSSCQQLGHRRKTSLLCPRNPNFSLSKSIAIPGTLVPPQDSRLPLVSLPSSPPRASSSSNSAPPKKLQKISSSPNSCESSTKLQKLRSAIAVGGATADGLGVQRPIRPPTPPAGFAPSQQPNPLPNITDDSLARERVASANEVLREILEKHPVTSTMRQYKVYFSLWQAYCDTSFGGDYSVDSARILKFFKDVMFLRTVKKFVSQGTDDSGQIGLAPRSTGAKSSQDTKASTSILPRKHKKLDREELIDPIYDPWFNKRDPTWKPLEKSTNLDRDEWSVQIADTPTDDMGQSSNALDGLSNSAGNEYDGGALEDNLEDGDDPNDEIEDEAGDDDEYDPEDGDGDDDDPEDLPPPSSGSKRVPKEQKIKFINSISDGSKVIKKAEFDKYGRKVLDVPVGMETIEGARKALIYLWKQQTARTASCPNPASNPRKDEPLEAAIIEYRERLHTTHESTQAARNGTCAIRDPYTERMFIRMISFTWRKLPIPPRPGKRSYDSKTRFPYIREHFCLLARHHMLLRDEDIRNLNLSDTFNVQTRRNTPGSTLASGLVFCIHRGKTNHKGVNTYAAAYRHKNFLRCTVAAFAFLMLERFDVEKEPIDFSNTDEWHNIKVIVSGTTLQRRLRYRTVPIAARTQIDNAGAIMRTCEVYSNKVTLAGRHAGASEAYNLGLNLDHMKHLGRWCMGQTVANYIPKNPTVGAFYMAHFNRNDEPYFIERDLVTPPLPLQRLIFPWIEHSFDKDMPEKTESWIEECDREMMGINTSEATDEDCHWTPAPGYTPQESTTSQDRLSSKLHDTALINRIGFLRLLVRLRRVILQDTVLYLNPNMHGQTLTNSLIASLPDIFQSQLFFDFQSQLLEAIEDHQKRSGLINSNVQVDGQAIHSINSLGYQAQNQSQVRNQSQVQNQNQNQNQMNQVLLALSEVQKQNQLLLMKLHEIQQVQHAHAAWLQARSLPQQNSLQNPHPHPQQQLVGQPQSFCPCSRCPAPRNDYPFAHTSHPHIPIPQLNQSSANNSTVQNSQQQQQQQQQQRSHPLLARDDPFIDYQMLPDQGKLTVKKAWEEFHNEVAQARGKNTRWPFSSKSKKLYSRRLEFINMIKREAKEKNRTEDSIVEEWTEKYHGRTINSIRMAIRKHQATEKGDAIDEEQDVQGIDSSN